MPPFKANLLVALLQSEVGTKYFCSRHEWSHEKCYDIFPEMFDPFQGFPKGGFVRGGNLNNWGGAHTGCNN